MIASFEKAVVYFGGFFFGLMLFVCLVGLGLDVRDWVRARRNDKRIKPLR